MVLTCHLYPVRSEIVLEQTECTERIVLVDIISLELIQDDEHEQLHEHFLAEKDIHQPEQQVVQLRALCNALACDVPLSYGLEHVKIPILPRSYDE